MKGPRHEEEEDDEQCEVFLDEDDVIQEITIDEEVIFSVDADLPDADDDEETSSDAELVEEVVDSMNTSTDDTDTEKADDSLQKLTGHTGELFAVACSPTDPTMVATGGRDEKGFLWKIGQGDRSLELQGHEDSVAALAFSTDGQLLASGSYDGRIQIWDTSSSLLWCTLEGCSGSIEWLRWHPRGHLVLAGSNDFSVWMWNAYSRGYLNKFSGHENVVTCGDFTPDGKTICTGSDDATLRTWNPRTGENTHVVRFSKTKKTHDVRDHPYHAKGVICLVISSDSTLAFTGLMDGSVQIVHIPTGKVVSSLLAHSEAIECIGFSPSFALLATGSLDQNLIIWDMQHLSIHYTFNHEGGVTCLTWLGSSRYVAAGGVDGKIQVWDILYGCCVKTFSGHPGAIQSLAVSANGDFLVSASLCDNAALLFDIAEFK